MGREETRAALEAWLTPKLPKVPRRKNKSPEFDLTVVPCFKWMQDQGFMIHVVESAAVYSFRAGRYLRGMTTTGMPDMVGALPTGTALFVEAKAPGKRATLRPAQRDFLEKAIGTNAFAVCVDSLDMLTEVYHQWLTVAPDQRPKLLLDHLPREPKRRARPGCIRV